MAFEFPILCNERDSVMILQFQKLTADGWNVLENNSEIRIHLQGTGGGIQFKAKVSWTVCKILADQ